jgi:hypothetical protein
MLNIKNDLLIATDEILVSLLVLLNCYKAFESFIHHLICSKLSNQFSFTTTSVISLIMSYLSDRSQCVQTDDALSVVLSITLGVVQGSVLGLLLFSMFIKDIVCQITSCRVHLYADDVQIYISCEPHYINNRIHNMNMELDRIHKWYIEKCLAINTVKYQALLVNPYILRSPIVSPLLLGSNHNAFVDKVKNLGMIKLLSFAMVCF